MPQPLRLTFVTSAPAVGDLPASRAEVAVIGRSNVGKSSLLNALAGQRDLAKVSSKPGRTTLLNVFETEGGNVVDFPGYGYASTSKTERGRWDQRLRQYLRERQQLVVALVLVDGEIGPTRLDIEMLAWLRSEEVPIKIVATKHDKVKSSRRARRKRDLAAGCEVPPGEVLWVSAARGVGIDRLRAFVRESLAP